MQKPKVKVKAEPASIVKKGTSTMSRPAPRPVVAAQKASPAPTVAATPANGKPGKNPAGFSNRELEALRDGLLAKRRELIGDMSSMESEALRSNGGSNLSNLPIHMADMGTDNYEQEFTLGLVQKERDLLKEINSALAKIKNGTYGLCEGTGQPIIKERLEYQPWARYSVEYQRKMERHGR
ncbi:MAG TPA: TraR/DksA C4-type zinc finger protein [Humisphaera sp.]|nr:TraR/DksA C4-type zinc finger protein [Humisphaera sp.]